MSNESLFNDWVSPISDTRNELVFEHRNKQYGAYVLRKKYRDNVIWAFLITSFAGVMFAATPAIIAKIKGLTKEKKVITRVETVTIEAPPPPKDEPPPPPPPPPPAPQVKTIRFVAPVIKDDARDDEPPPSQDDIKDPVSTKTQDGDDDPGDIVIIPDAGGDGDGPTGPVPFNKVEIKAQFPGGEDGWFKFLQDNLVYPDDAIEMNVEGSIELEFIVDLDGAISSINVLKGVAEAPSLEDEARRVLKRSPKWSPGIQNGRKVVSWRRVSIDFVLN